MSQDKRNRELQAKAVISLALEIQKDADEALKPVIEKHRALFHKPRLEQVENGLIGNLECIYAQLDEIVGIHIELERELREMSDSKSENCNLNGNVPRRP